MSGRSVERTDGRTAAVRAWMDGRMVCQARGGRTEERKDGRGEERKWRGEEGTDDRTCVTVERSNGRTDGRTVGRADG